MTIYQKIILILFRLIGLYFIATGALAFLVSFNAQVIYPFFTSLFPSNVAEQIGTPSPISGFIAVILSYPLLYVLLGVLIFKISLRLSETVCKNID